jgi:hypothetical protein
MAYYIFLKSLRSLEEFRKNPHVKIPPKSPSTNFQRLGKFKNPIFNSEIPFLGFGLADLAAHPASQPSQLTGRAAPIGRNRLPFWFTPSEPAASPTSLCQLGPRCQFHPPPPATRARSRCHRFSATERSSAPRLGCHRAVTTSPSLPLP